MAPTLGLETTLTQVAKRLRPYISIDYEALARDLGDTLAQQDAPVGDVLLFYLSA